MTHTNKCLEEWVDSNWHKSFSFLPSWLNYPISSFSKVPDSQKCDRKGHLSQNCQIEQIKQICKKPPFSLLNHLINSSSRICHISCNYDDILSFWKISFICLGKFSYPTYLYCSSSWLSSEWLNISVYLELSLLKLWLGQAKTMPCHKYPCQGLIVISINTLVLDFFAYKFCICFVCAQSSL